MAKFKKIMLWVIFGPLGLLFAFGVFTSLTEGNKKPTASVQVENEPAPMNNELN